MIINYKLFLDSINYKPLKKYTVSYKGDIFKPLFESIIDFLFDYFNLNNKIEKLNIKYIKNIKNSNGYVSISSRYDYPKNVIIIDGGLDISVRYTIHELTHIKQIYNDELYLSDTHIVYKGEPFIEYNSYLEIVKKHNYNKYITLPWEVEAIENETKLKKLYLESEHFEKLLSKDENIKFLYNLGGFLR